MKVYLVENKIEHKEYAVKTINKEKFKTIEKGLVRFL